MRISGDNTTFYNCKFIGFQDAFCDNRGMHFFKDCYIEGTIDFIFRNGSCNNTMYLCHAWKPRPRVIFAFTNFDG
ncbi:hypothetical protein GOBAR_DD18206 [Gossypium barbadense]|nr:hypothetical protein GOBAR_DD18206 [Gossypium barbadense]